MQDRGPQLAGVSGALLAFSIAAVSVRCYVRLSLTKSFGYDDWLIIATLVLYFLYSVFVLVGVRHGTGQLKEELTAGDFSTAMEMWFFSEILYGLSSTFTKLAAGTLLLRLTTKRLHIQIIRSIMLLASLFGVAFVAQIIAQYRSIVLGFTYAHAAVSSLGDWTFGILPALIVSGLNMNFRTKVSVFLVLCLANIGSIATLIRIKAIHQISTSDEFLFATVDLAVWSSVEVGVAIIASSIATYRPLFRSFLSTGNTSNRSFGTGDNLHHFPDSQSFGRGTPQNLSLREMKRDHKTAHSHTSSSESSGMAHLARGV